MARHWLIAAAALTVVTSTTGPGTAEAFKRLEVGHPAGDHTLATPTEEIRQLAEVLGPGATAIAFWASWSPRSLEALAGLQELYSAHGERGLTVVAVNADGPGHDPAIAELLGAGMGTDVVQLVDRDLTLYDAYGVVAVPSLILLDSSGTVAALSTGYSRSGREEFSAHARRVLGVHDPKSAPAETADGYRPSDTARKHFRMGQLYLHKHRTEKGLELLARALAEDPLYQEARSTLAAALRKAGHPDEATRLELAASGSEEYCLVPRRNRSASQWQ